MISGRVWKFGDNINTDLMLPGAVVYGSEEDQRRAVFAAVRPGWVDQVRRGDIIVGGHNYGTGSSRPAARSLVSLGIGCLLAESINGLFLRNCVSYGLVALECAGVSDLFDEGQVAEISMDDFTVRNMQTHMTRRATPLPARLLATMRAGGVLPFLESQGFISPPKAQPVRRS